MEENIRTHPDRLICPQCSSTDFIETGEIFAMTPISKNPDDEVLFYPEASRPVVAYTCQHCGHILLFDAKHLDRI